MFEQLKQQYLVSFEAKIKSLEQALETQNAQALTAQVHQLSGSSGSYGFEEIAQLCQEIEAETNDMNSIDLSMKEKTNRLIALMQNQLASI
ncbi:MAG: Hpt domain-containing protein [Marinicella sp.]